MIDIFMACNTVHSAIDPFGYWPGPVCLSDESMDDCQGYVEWISEKYLSSLMLIQDDRFTTY